MVETIIYIGLGLLFEVVLAVSSMPSTPKWITVGAVAVMILLLGVRKFRREKSDQHKARKESNYLTKMADRSQLAARGFDQAYIDGLGDNPYLKQSFWEGQALVDEYRMKEAVAKFKICLDHPHASNSNIAAANILLGKCYSSMGNYKEAVAYLKAGIRSARRIKDPKDSGIAQGAGYGTLGNTYWRQSKLGDAEKYDKKAIGMFERAGHKPGLGAAYANLGAIALERGKGGEKAVLYLDKAAKIAEELGDDEMLMSILGNGSIALAMMGLAKECRDNLLAILVKAEKMGDQSSIARSLLNIGTSYEGEGDHARAIENFAKAKERYTKIGDVRGIAMSDVNIGLSEYRRGNVAEGLRSMRDGRKGFERMGNQTEVARAEVVIKQMEAGIKL